MQGSARATFLQPSKNYGRLPVGKGQAAAGLSEVRTPGAAAVDGVLGRGAIGAEAAGVGLLIPGLAVVLGAGLAAGFFAAALGLAADAFLAGLAFLEGLAAFAGFFAFFATFLTTFFLRLSSRPSSRFF